MKKKNNGVSDGKKIQTKIFKNLSFIGTKNQVITNLLKLALPLKKIWFFSFQGYQNVFTYTQKKIKNLPVTMFLYVEPKMKNLRKKKFFLICLIILTKNTEVFVET